MNKFKEKTQPFIMGLMVGLLIAGGFFILKLDNYFKELNFYKTFIHTFTSETKTPEKAENTKDTNPATESKTTEGVAKNKFTLGNDSSKTKNETSSSVSEKDTLTIGSSIDSLVDSKVESDEIVVRKDELLSTKTMEVINLNPVSAKAYSKDSLLQKVSGVQDDKISGKQLFNIEFWQSPINYRGYKMSKYKIVLFGIASADAIKVFKTDDAIYLKNQTMVYKLDYASELRSYERVNDESIINKLK